MLQHGRKSQSPLTLAAEQAAAPKLDPPDHFNKAERAEWHALVDRLGDAWLPPECHILTETLVSATCSLSALNQEISKFNAKLPKDVFERRLFADLVKLRGALLAQVMALSTKLRIAPSTRNDLSQAHAMRSSALGPRRRLGLRELKRPAQSGWQRGP